MKREGGFAAVVRKWDAHISTPENELIAKAAILGATFEPYTTAYGSYIRARVNGSDEGGWITHRRAAIAALLVLEQL